MLQKAGVVSSWNDLAKEIETTYGPSIFDHPRFALFKLFQESSVTNYYHTFMALANRVTGLSANALLDCFLSGLKKELLRDVIPWHPNTITKAITLARLYEDKYGFGGGGLHPSKFKQSYVPDISAASIKPVPLALPTPPATANRPPALLGPSVPHPSFKKMSYSELQ